MNIKEKAQQHGLTYKSIINNNEYPENCHHYVESERIHGAKGYYYDYALFDKDNNLFALGEENGNYSGGIYAYKDVIDEYTYSRNLRDFLMDIVKENRVKED